jgi:hypothetical protein
MGLQEGIFEVKWYFRGKMEVFRGRYCRGGGIFNGTRELSRDEGRENYERSNFLSLILLFEVFRKFFCFSPLKTS